MCAVGEHREGDIFLLVVFTGVRAVFNSPSVSDRASLELRSFAADKGKKLSV